MTLRTAAAAFLLAALCYVSLPAAQGRIMPVDEIRPGMTGIGRTVFEGAELSDFKVHIIGVLRNVQGPKRDLILARLEGGPLAETGVAQGMSGSPVYIDGRLIGAVGYSIGLFPKEAIAGITPIEEMKDATAMPSRRAGDAGMRIELPVTAETLAAALRQSYARLAPFATTAAVVESRGLPAAEGAQLATMLRPIATPLLMSGFEPATVELLSAAFRDAGFAPVVGAAGGGRASARELAALNGPLREGDAVGVSLVSGDVEMGATGTITHIDGDRVYAFGHPFFGLGPTQLPMRRAFVYSMLPSLMTSFKISTLGDVIGTVKQDRATAVAGVLGPAPETVPMRVTLRSTRADVTTTRTFNFEIATDQTFTPLLAYVTLFNALASHERQFGSATFVLKGRAKVAGHADVTFEDVFAGEAPTLAAATSIGGPLTMLLGNDREPVKLDGLEFTIDASEAPLAATIERVWIDELRPRAGRTLPVKVLTRSYRGDETISTVPVEIPANVSGTVSILVSDGRQLNAIEQREMRRTVQPQSVEQMIRVLNQTRRNNRIYVRLLTGAPGAVVNGEVLAALPPSVLSVLEGDRNGGSFSPIRSAAVGEYEIPMNVAVSGSRTLTIDVENRR
ncbi:MAG TPA: SpoIVB peptidase S55 domain-containing protein [Vicinamibacterales bacterium]|nr:SpoIVB peptidase S55 domain-containing protein [Vicinamibacterales bacterium]